MVIFYLVLAMASINLFLFLVILRKRFKEKKNIFFALTIFGIFLWSIGIASFRVITEDWLYFFEQVVYFSVGLSAVSFFFFSFYFPTGVLPKNKIIKIILFIFSLFLLLITLIPGVLLEKAFYIDGKKKLFFNWGYYFYSIGLTTALLLAFAKFIYKYKRSKYLYKLQLKYLFLGCAIFVAIALTTNLLLPSLGNTEYNWVGPLSSIIMFAFTAYSIIKYRLMGIRVIVSKFYMYVILAMFSYAFFYFVHFTEIWLWGSVTSANSLTFGFFIAVVYSVIFLRVLNYIQISSDVLFFKGYNPRKIIKDLTIELRGVIKLNEIFKIFKKNFKKVLETEELMILIFKNGDKKGEHIISKKYSFNPIEINRKGRLFLDIHNKNDLIIRDELKDKSLKKELDKIKAKIVAPLITQKETFGAIILGEKISRSAYTQEDIEFVEIISTQAAVAIQNALLYQEVSDLSLNLQKKVDEQTEDIKQKAEHLQKLLKMRSEFLDIASHQLRTPVTVIKGALSMILDGSIKEEAKKTEFIKASFQKSIKLTDVINDILRASEMDTDKFELDLGPVDIQVLLEEAVKDKKMETDDKKLKLILELPKKKLPQVLSDEKYMKQVIVNLINNSIQYTKKGFIKVSAEKKGKQVIIRVSDSGIGIPKEEQPKLFQKFARADNAVETFTDGSGLGLFIIKQVIDAHKGAEVKIEKSEINKGTTFAIKLPIAK